MDLDQDHAPNTFRCIFSDRQKLRAVGLRALRRLPVTKGQEPPSPSRKNDDSDDRPSDDLVLEASPLPLISGSSTNLRWYVW